MEQDIGVTRLRDGSEVAHAISGDGPPLLVIGGWLSDLESGWALPSERRMWESLGRGRTVLRYDRAGCGRSGVTGSQHRSMRQELATVDAVLGATGTERADVLGWSLGVPVAIAWAAAHPSRVGRLVLYGGWAEGSRIASPETQQHVAGLVRAHWGMGSDLLTDMFAPDAMPGERAAFSRYQRNAASAETAARLLEFCYTIDVADQLSLVRAETLVLHREGDRAAPIRESRRIAAEINGAELAVLPGRSHLPYVGDAGAVVGAVRRFLGLPEARATAPQLTRRQDEVAALVAEGLTNREIGLRLGIAEKSAAAHLERIRLRLGLRSRVQVAAWWVASNA